MAPPPFLIPLAWWTLSALILAGAVLVVALDNLFRAALSLGLVLVGVAGLFVLVGAELLAFVQILIYVGAVLTLVVFAIMLTARVQGPTVAGSNRGLGPAAAAALALFALLASVIAAIPTEAIATPPTVSLQQLGRELVTTLVLPFEVIGVVLVAALVGAIAVAASLKPPQAPPSPSASR